MSRIISDLTQAYRNVFRNKRRSLVTALAILSGFVGLALLAGYVARVERYLMVNTVYLNHNGHVSIFKKNGIDKYFSRPGKYLLSPDDVNKINEVVSSLDAEVEATFPAILGNGLLQVGTLSYPFQGKGVSSEADWYTRNHDLVKTWTTELRSQEKGPTFKEAEAALNPIKLTFRLSDHFKDATEVQVLGLTTDNSLNALDATVVARFSTGLELTEETNIMTSLPVMQELLATDGVTNLSLYLKSDSKTGSVVKSLNERFHRDGLEFEAYPYYDERIGLFYTGTMNFLYAMATFFFSLVSLVVILSIANVISMNIVERIRELGTMRAIGYTPKDLSKLMALENLFLAGIAIFFGFLFAQLIAWGVNEANIRFFPPGIAGSMQFVLTPWVSLCALLAIPLVIMSYFTAYIVTKKKLNSDVSALLTETTT